MKKIPFDIKYRPQIESGEIKVVTRDGRLVRIVCWDLDNKNYPIVGLLKTCYDDRSGYEYPSIFSIIGEYDTDCADSKDLFLLIDEPNEVDQEIVDAMKDKSILDMIPSGENTHDIIKEKLDMIITQLSNIYEVLSNPYRDIHTPWTTRPVSPQPLDPYYMPPVTCTTNNNDD